VIKFDNNVQDGKVASQKKNFSVYVAEEFRPSLEKFALLLRMSEGQILKMCFEDLATMVDQRGDEKLPRVVHLIRAAEDYEAAPPKITSYPHSRDKRSNSSLNEKKGAKS
jgi:hypothetical protein